LNARGRSQSWAKPTALGNALRAAEVRPQVAYGLDGVVVWLRLYPLLPEAMRSLLGDAQSECQLNAELSAVLRQRVPPGHVSSHPPSAKPG
jgi:hypothetical protein